MVETAGSADKNDVLTLSFQVVSAFVMTSVRELWELAGMSGIIRIMAVTALAALVAGCGARGALEPPPGAQTDPQPDPPFVLDKVI